MTITKTLNRVVVHATFDATDSVAGCYVEQHFDLVDDAGAVISTTGETVPLADLAKIGELLPSLKDWMELAEAKKAEDVAAEAARGAERKAAADEREREHEAGRQFLAKRKTENEAEAAAAPAAAGAKAAKKAK